MFGVLSFDLNRCTAVVTGAPKSMGAASCVALAHYGDPRLWADISDEARVQACVEAVLNSAPLRSSTIKRRFHLGYRGGDEPADTMRQPLFDHRRVPLAALADGAGRGSRPPPEAAS